jgi:uncharacterized integral membrane protein
MVLIPSAIVLAALVALSWQSNAPTHIRFLVWSIDEVPLAGVVLGAAGLGLLLAGTLFWAERIRLRARLRAAQAPRSSGAEPACPPQRD